MPMKERKACLFVLNYLILLPFFFFFLFFLVKSTMRSSPSISSDESQVDKAIESGSSGNWSME
jgi:riboflavin transporter FmnP